MPFDGMFLYCLTGELGIAKDAHIDKIHQPSKEELVLVLRKKGFVKKLLLSAKSGMARMQFTDNSYENPDKPPMFCMLARKHFSSAKFTGVKLFGFERVAALEFDGTNELGDRTNVKIICEFMGSGNIILVGNDGRILDAVHRSDIEKDARVIAPGAVYTLPDGLGRENLLNCDTEKTAAAIFEKSGRLPEKILSSLEGVSPLTAREIAELSGEDADDFKPLESQLNNLKNILISGGSPYIYYDEGGSPKEFTFLKLTQYGDSLKCEKCDSFSELLDRFYSERERINLQNRAGGDLKKLLKTLIARANKRMNLRKKELEGTKDREKYRIWGELIKANIYAIENGSTKAVVPNFYDSEGGNIEIPLDPSLTPQNNAAKYFKEYKKSYAAEQSLGKLIESDIAEIEYLESVAECLERAKTVSEIAEIRQELGLGGYIKSGGGKKRNSTVSKPLEYKSAEGYKILVGKNNLQNDYITCTLASKNDMWFHTKNIHGAHAVVFSGGKPISDETLLFAAKLAALNSKAADSSGVPVDYTMIKNVKKPAGAKAGMVIYTTNKTLFVTPKE